MAAGLVGEVRWDIFIAHSGADIVLAEQLYERLVPDARVFLDSRCLLPGDDWDRELAKAQAHSLVTVVLVSPQTEWSYYQRDEIAAAIAMARDENAHRVVPLLWGELDQKLVVPYGLRLKHSVKVTGDDGMASAAAALVSLLNHIAVREPGDAVDLRAERPRDIVRTLKFASIGIASGNPWVDWRVTSNSGKSRIFDWRWDRLFELPSEREADPCFDVTLLNSGVLPIVLSAVGVQIWGVGDRYTPVGAEDLEVMIIEKKASIRLNMPNLFTELLAEDERRANVMTEEERRDFVEPASVEMDVTVLQRMADPMYLRPGAPVRYDLMLGDYLKNVPPFALLQLVAEANGSLIHSERLVLMH